VVQVPSSVLTGCYVPVQLKAGGVVSNMVTMAVSSHGQCSDPSNPFTAALRIGGNLGTLGIVHSSAALSAFPGDGVADQAFAVFQSKPAVVNNQVFDRLYSYPPPGACTLYNGRGNLLAGDGVPIPSPGLKAGALGLTGSANSQNLDYFASPGFYFKLLSVTGFGLPPFGSMPLSPGNYTMNSDGAGPQIGGFQSGATLPGPAAWVSPDKLAAIPRTQPLNVTWSAPAGGQVLIAGGDYDSSRDVSAAFLCAAAAAAGALAVPTEILQAIPALQPSQIPNTGRILLGFFPAPAPFTAAGLNFGAFIAPSYLEREVIFQ
jgi:hypothetical protein